MSLIIACHIIQRKEPYHELGSDYFDKRRLVYFQIRYPLTR
jgi:hypothetical protein